jgi:transcription termination factor Rho
MSETQLERSVLEAKDRDELFAIADALGARPPARARKSDLIDEILRATGIEQDTPDASRTEPAPIEARARRPRARRATPVDESDRSNNAEDGTDGAGDRLGAEAVSSGSEGLNGPPAVLDAPAPSPTNGAGTELDPDVSQGSQDEAGPDRRGEETTYFDAVGQDGRDLSDGLGVEDRIDEIHRPETGDGAELSQRGGAEAGTGLGQRSFEADPGNRRNRRRRGRDRFERGERDLPGQSVESQFSGEPIPMTGYLDLRDEGYGFLRTSGFLSGPGDVYVSISQVRRFALRKGDYLEGAARPAGGNEKYPALLRIDSVSGLTPDEARNRPRFENLTPLFPDTKLRLEMPTDPANLTARIVDLISPIGKGQRGMIVSPPKAGKTTILKQIAHSIEANNPDVHLMVLLVDERPEEVTDMRRSVKGEVIASTFDRPAEEHTQVAELAIERAKRMVETGKDVVIVLDGITRLARAYNLAQPATGRIMSGGIDTGALYPPKKFFGAARNIEEGGSLTILATALVETGSRMDEVIFEEFKGTGNMELRLDRRLAERRIYPAIDVNASSTRHEELLFDRVQLQQVWKLRRVLNALASEGSTAAGLELLLDRIKSTRSNDEFLAEVAKTPTPAL